MANDDDPAESNGRRSLRSAKSYEVGYGKPPKHGQFSAERQPTKRRPRGPATSPMAALEKALNKLVTVTSKSGKLVKMPLKEVVIQQTLNAAVKGDHRSIALVMKQLSEIEKLAHDRGPTSAELAAKAEETAERHQFSQNMTAMLNWVAALKKAAISGDGALGLSANVIEALSDWREKRGLPRVPEDGCSWLTSG